MALLDSFSPQTRHNKIGGFPSKIESKRNITFIGLSWAHLFYFLLTTTHTWAFIWVRMFQRVLIEYFFLLSIYPLPITAAVSLKASLITLLFEQQLVDTCCHLVEQHLNVLPVTSCCLHRTYEDHYFRWINNVWTNNVKLRLSMAHLMISHSTLMSQWLGNTAIGYGLHECTHIEGKIEAVSITTPTSSGFCHVIRKKLLQGSNLTEQFHWENKKVILSFN